MTSIRLSCPIKGRLTGLRVRHDGAGAAEGRSRAAGFRQGPRFRSGRFCHSQRWCLQAQSGNGADGGGESFHIENLRPRPAGIDVRLPLQIATANVASRQVSGPCRATPIGAVSARSRHQPKPQPKLAMGGERTPPRHSHVFGPQRLSKAAGRQRVRPDRGNRRRRENQNSTATPFARGR